MFPFFGFGGMWVPTYEQFVTRKKLGKVKEKFVTNEEYDELVESIEADRRFVIIHDDVGDTIFIRLEYPVWLEYKTY